MFLTITNCDFNNKLFFTALFGFEFIKGYNFLFNARFKVWSATFTNWNS